MSQTFQRVMAVIDKHSYQILDSTIPPQHTYAEVIYYCTNLMMHTLKTDRPIFTVWRTDDEVTTSLLIDKALEQVKNNPCEEVVVFKREGRVYCITDLDSRADLAIADASLPPEVVVGHGSPLPEDGVSDIPIVKPAPLTLKETLGKRTRRRSVG